MRSEATNYARRGGKATSEGRIKLEALNHYKLVKLFRDGSTKKIAEMYGISESTASKVINRRLFPDNDKPNMRDIEDIKFSNEEYKVSHIKGAWRNSPEGKCFYNNKAAIMYKLNNERK